MRQFLRHGAVVFGGVMLANVMAYVFYATCARGLGVETAGLFASLISTMMVLTLPAAVAATVIAKVVADACARGDRGTMRAMATWSSVSIVPVAIVAAGAATLGNGALRGFFHTEDALAIVLAMAGFAVTFPLAAQRAVLQGAAKYEAYAGSMLVDAAGKAVTGVLVLTAMRAGGLRFALAGYLVSTLAAYAVNVVLCGPEGPAERFVGLPRRVVVRMIFGVAVPIAATTAMTFADGILVRHYLPARDAGFYNSAIALVGRAIVTVVQFVPVVLLPRAAAEVAAGRNPVRFLVAALAVGGAVSAAVLVVVAAFPTTVVAAISGPAFLGAAPLLLPYGVAMSLLAGATVLCSYLIGIDRHGFALPLTAVAVLEIAGIAAVHPNITAVVHIVLAGHAAAFSCCLADALFSLRAPQGIGRREAEVSSS